MHTYMMNRYFISQLRKPNAQCVLSTSNLVLGTGEVAIEKDRTSSYDPLTGELSCRKCMNHRLCDLNQLGREWDVFS